MNEIELLHSISEAVIRGKTFQTSARFDTGEALAFQHPAFWVFAGQIFLKVDKELELLFYVHSILNIYTWHHRTINVKPEHDEFGKQSPLQKGSSWSCIGIELKLFPYERRLLFIRWAQ